MEDAKHRVNMKIKGPRTDASHGMIDQSFNRNIQVINGRLDESPKDGRNEDDLPIRGLHRWQSQSLQHIRSLISSRNPYQTYITCLPMSSIPMMSIETNLEERLIGAGDTAVTCVTPVDSMSDIDTSEYYDMTANVPPFFEVCPPPSPVGRDGKQQCETVKMWFAQGPVDVWESEERPSDDEAMGMRKKARIE